MRHIAFIIAAAAVTMGTAHAAELSDTLIQEVVITGTRSATDVRHLSQTVNVIDRAAIEETNRSSLLPLLTEQVPGLFITQRGYAGYGVSDGAAGTISMRGLTGSGTAVRTLVLIDGHPNYAGIFGHPIADSYQSLMTERVEVLRGPASMLYGSYAMSGVINIVTKKPQDGTHAYLHAGYGSFNTAETEFSVNTHKDKLSAVASASYNRTDGHRDNLNFEQFGGYAKLAYDISKNWNASANVDVTRFKASYPGPETAPLTDADQDITRGTASLFIENNYDRTSGGASVFHSWGDHWINDGYQKGNEEPKDFRFTSYDEMTGVSAWQSVNLFEGNRITLGVDYYRYGGKVVYDSIGNRTDSLLIDKREHELAGYIEVRQDIGSWMTLNAGLRADHHFSIGTELVPQFGAAFHLPANAEIKLSAAKGFRYPTFKDNYLFLPKNPDLEPESLWNYELSFSQTLLSGRLYYGINLFHMDVKNTIQALPKNGAPLNQNTGELKNSGVEVEASYLISKSFTLNGNYSYLKMETPVVGAPEHKVYMGGSYNKDRWHASTGLQYINSLYTTPSKPKPATVLAALDKKEDFLLWNARVSYQLNDMVQLWVNGDNLLNTKYQIIAGYPMPGIAFMAGFNVTL
jgi:iron complex outermembrane receptor protein